MFDTVATAAYDRAMAAPPSISPKCFFAALIFAWATFIFLPSALIALAGLSPPTAGKTFLAATFAIADEVAPAAKIGFALILAALLFAARRLVRRSPPVILDVALACAAMLVTLALLPASWSRGFGIGLTGVRFALAPLAAYLVGSAFAGLLFNFSEAKCRRRDYPDG